MYVTATGIVLTACGVREYDRLVTLYTRELGKVRAVFRGVLRPRAKLLPLTQPATELEVQLYLGRNSGGERIARAAGARLVEQFLAARTSLDAYLFACGALELTDCLTLDLLPDERKYSLLRRALEQAGGVRRPEKVLLAFTLRLVKLCGYLPELDACVVCRRPCRSANWFFAPAAGGIVCPLCAASVRGGAAPIAAETVHLLRKFCTLSSSDVDALDTDATRLQEARRVVYAHLRQYLHRPLKTIPVETA